MVPSSILQRVLYIRIGNRTGTAFVVEVGGRQYAITAKHLLPASGKPFPLMVSHEGDWKSMGEVVPMPAEPDEVDVAVLAAKTQLSPLTEIALGAETDPFLSEEVYILGFPFGFQGESSHLNNGFPVPFVKRGITAGFEGWDARQRIILDAMNNHGMSGGPVICMRDRTPMVVGVISDFEFETRNVSDRGAETSLTVTVNSGLASAYPIGRAIEAIEREPIGFAVGKS